MGSCETPDSNGVARDVVEYSKQVAFEPYCNLSVSWFESRVFYLRISNIVVDDQTPEFLRVNHIPLDPNTLLEVNGVRCSMYSDGISLVLRRDRVDKKCEEATFVSTDSVRFTGNVKFEVFDKEDLFLTGVLEMPKTNKFSGESKDGTMSWCLNCESEMSAGTGFLKGNRSGRHEDARPIVEVYVAGCFSGSPIILSKTLQLPFRKKPNKKPTLDVIPELERSSSISDSGSLKDFPLGLDLQMAQYRDYSAYHGALNNPYWKMQVCLEGDDSELSWFNAGVRVGVGIGLGVCVGVGVGVGLLVRTCQATTRGFRGRLF